MKKTTKKKAAVLALSAASAAAMMAPMAMPAFAASSKTPGAVAGVTVTQSAKAKVTVAWKKAANAKYYRVYTTNGTKYVRAAQTKATRATLNVKRGKTLKVKVRGVNGKKLGRLSSAKSLYVLADPAAPAVSTTVEKDGSITATWKADKNADKYTVYISTDGKAFSKAGTTKGTSVTVKANDLDVKYVKVIAANEYAKASSSAFEVGKSSVDPGKTESTGSQSESKDAEKTDTKTDNKTDAKKDDVKDAIDGKAVVMSDSLFRKTFKASSNGKTIKVKRPAGTGVDMVKLDILSVDEEGYQKSGNLIGGTTSTGNHYGLSYNKKLDTLTYNNLNLDDYEKYTFGNALGAGNAYTVTAKAPYQIAWTLDGTEPQYNQKAVTGTSKYVMNEDGSTPEVQLRGTYSDGKEHVLSAHITNEETHSIYWVRVYDKNGKMVAEGYKEWNTKK